MSQWDIVIANAFTLQWSLMGEQITEIFSIRDNGQVPLLTMKNKSVRASFLIHHFPSMVNIISSHYL